MSVMFKEQAQVVVLVKAVNSWCLWKPWICSLQGSDLWRVCAAIREIHYSLESTTGDTHLFLGPWIRYQCEQTPFMYQKLCK